MNRTANRINNKVSRLAFLGGGTIFGYMMIEPFISPFIPLIITILGSLIVGFLFRAFFIWLANKKYNSTYRYSNTQQQTYTRTQNSGSSSEKRENITSPPPPDSLLLYRNLLGLGTRFTKEELKTAYRSKAAMYHPDRYASASQKERENAELLMKQVNEAYDLLKAAAV